MPAPERFDELSKLLRDMLDEAADDAAQALYVRIRHEPENRVQLLGALDGLPLVKAAMQKSLGDSRGRF
jgi:hypothetical protein